jgi:hypothetical protein
MGQVTGYSHMVGGRLREVAQQCIKDMLAVNVATMTVPGQITEQSLVEQRSETDPGQCREVRIGEMSENKCTSISLPGRCVTFPAIPGRIQLYRYHLSIIRYYFVISNGFDHRRSVQYNPPRDTQ